MGLLTNPENRNKIASFVSAYANLVSILMICGGTGWFIILSHPMYNGGTYFSENALLPGLVESQFNSQKVAEGYYDGYRKQLKLMKTDTDVPIEWLHEEMMKIGLEVHTHDYKFTYPMNLIQNRTASGTNVYGILRASKTASTESIVMTAPLRPSGSGLIPTDGSVALMLALAKHMRRSTYWAKDIVFLFTQHEFVGMQAWLDGYHQTQISEHIMAGDLPARSGSIQAAINLEFEKSVFSAINLKIEGSNGQLPNLDVVNLVSRLSKDENIPPMLHLRADQYQHYSDIETVKYNAVTMFLMMCQQASGMPSGNHGLFLRFHIEALTLQSVPGSKFGFRKLGRLVDGVFRSINNLLERFHQSFFFYLLPCTTRYVSIGVYMPPFALITVAGLIQAIALWTRFSKDIETRNDKVNANKDKAFSADGKFTPESLKLLRLPDNVFQGITRILPILIGCQLAGLLLSGTPGFFGSGEIRQIPASDAVILGGAAIFISSLLLTFTALRKEEFDEMNWEIFKVIALIYHGLSLFALGLLNISLAAFLAVFTTPVYCFVRPISYRILSFLQAILVLLVSPPAIFIYIKLLYSFFTDGKLLDMNNLSQTTVDMQTALVYGLIDNFVFGNWLFNVMTLVVFPNWLMMWSIVWMNL